MKRFVAKVPLLIGLRRFKRGCCPRLLVCTFKI